ncbi:unnamed protein product [Symbiodinium natans]|uniref:ubiquitinyl hydrolase 1 n=1 Tax=Symbiodinium natans TaxID=878477 RepID=A0A812M3V9_9DINO|nr:unnamed protein product [Symbiodinium natans]
MLGLGGAAFAVATDAAPGWHIPFFYISGMNVLECRFAQWHPEESHVAVFDAEELHYDAWVSYPAGKIYVREVPSPLVITCSLTFVQQDAIDVVFTTVAGAQMLRIARLSSLPEMEHFATAAAMAAAAQGRLQSRNQAVCTVLEGQATPLGTVALSDDLWDKMTVQEIVTAAESEAADGAPTLLAKQLRSTKLKLRSACDKRRDEKLALENGAHFLTLRPKLPSACARRPVKKRELAKGVQFLTLRLKLSSFSKKKPDEKLEVARGVQFLTLRLKLVSFCEKRPDEKLALVNVAHFLTLKLRLRSDCERTPGKKLELADEVHVLVKVVDQPSSQIKLVLEVDRKQGSTIEAAGAGDEDKEEDVEAATYHAGVHARLDKSVREPGSAYVALSRSPTQQRCTLERFQRESLKYNRYAAWALAQLKSKLAKSPGPKQQGLQELWDSVVRPAHGHDHYEMLLESMQPFNRRTYLEEQRAKDAPADDTAQDMATAAETYLQEWQGIDEAESEHIRPGGWYSVQILYAALFNRGLALNLDEPVQSLDQAHLATALVQNWNNQHWVAYRWGADGAMYRFDSLQRGPERVSEADFATSLVTHWTYAVLLPCDM